ncbi:serine protease [Amycolatopsis antarctica]|uniref:Serine protease n=1 Tax=Amycolatopsis antarctica TaxID=1854586 RepID=A0A263CW99_9PSEU|nr:serine protease [Amycolatopsis antarctica]OZM70238.1 serine protease [Amycolatopsis antarctica]
MPQSNRNRNRRRWVIAATAVAGAVLVPAAASAVAAESPDSEAVPAPVVEPRIVGGEPASVGDHPYAVYLADSAGGQFCGGTLVSRNAVVTAAHCTASMSPADITVVAGREDTRTGEGEMSAVRDIWVSPDYTDYGSGNDIAVLKLTDSLRYRPAAVATAADAGAYAEGTSATVLGWGRTSEGGARSTILRGAQVPIAGDATCGQAFGNYDNRTMVCAGYPEGGVDACQGDSGGPLVVNGTLIGVVSFGEGCAQPGKPGVYTRVATYAEDIARESRR